MRMFQITQVENGWIVHLAAEGGGSVAYVFATSEEMFDFLRGVVYGLEAMANFEAPDTGPDPTLN